MLTVIRNFGNCRGSRGVGGWWMCLVQLLLVTRCSLSGSRHGCHCGCVPCCCVCVSKAFSSEPLTVRTCEVHWDVLILGILPLPPWDQPIMPPACKCLAEREGARESVLRQRHNGVCEGSMCAPLSLRLLFNCHVYPATTSHVISTQCSVICVVTPLYSTMGSLLLDWLEQRKLTYFMWEILIHSKELFSLCFQTAMGPINFWPVHIPGTAVAFNGLVRSGSHVTL